MRSLIKVPRKMSSAVHKPYSGHLRMMKLSSWTCGHMLKVRQAERRDWSRNVL